MEKKIKYYLENITKKDFRLLLFFSYFLLTWALVMDIIFPSEILSILNMIVDTEMNRFTSTHMALSSFSILLIFALDILSFIGLFLFKNWGRRLAILNLIAGLILISALVPQLIIMSSISDVFITLSTMIYTLILVLSFLDPINNFFESDKISLEREIKKK